ncbi:MAG: Citrate transporter [Firmicutes bacterium]|nr:Citrate transporter [Bacillota bacterium]
MDILIIFISLALLMVIAYRGYSVIIFAPVCALLAAVVGGFDLMPMYTEGFMFTMVGFIRVFFPLFLLGAVFGKVMEDSGSCKRIALTIVDYLGHKNCVLAIILTGIIMVYGGVSVHVVAFTIYPLAAALFKEADIPKRLIPCCFAIGAWTFAMDAIPGSPQIHNLIPTKYFGTTAYAAPMTGIIASIILFTCLYVYFQWRVKSLKTKGEGYGTGHTNEPDPEQFKDTSRLPSFGLSILPLIIVLVGNYGFTKWIQTWNPAMMKGFKTGASLQSMVGIWALVIALVIAILVCVALNWSRFQGVKGGLKVGLQTAVMGSLLAIMNTGSEVGYGNVISMQEGFKTIAAWLTTISFGNSPLLSEAIMINLLAGITGSASGGLGIALELMAPTYIEWANQSGLSLEIVHRIASMSSGGMDTLPHNGAVITLLMICGLTHKQSYPDIFAVTVMKSLIAFLMTILVTLFPFIK